MNMGNVIVGQSGGPTSVINSSLAGVYKTALEHGAKKVYGMLHGVEGLLQGNYIDLSEHISNELDIELLKRTPSSYLGSCRYKLPKISDNEQVYVKIFDLLKKLDVRNFFYIGGNDSMDTIGKLSEYASRHGADIRFMGVPKTIDNDLAVTDHTPGFGSAAKYIATTLKEIIRDSYAYGQKGVTIVEIMGRNAGWLTASSSLARTEDCPGPDMIYLPEVAFDVEDFVRQVDDMTKEKKSLIIAVSEGLRQEDGQYVCDLNNKVSFKDPFGHKALSGTAHYLSQKLSMELGCKTRPVEFSTIQRCASHIVSRTDVSEAFLAGGHAVKAAANGETAKMVIFIRVSDDPYNITCETCDIRYIANKEKKIPLEWIDRNNSYVSRAYETYAEFSRSLTL